MFVTTGDRNKVVVAKTKLRLCRARECQGCSNLHLCKMYLFGQCPHDREVCFTYNKGRGEYGNCPDKEACRRLHICESYIRGTCDDSSKCRRSHDFYEPHPMKNLQSQGVPSQLMGSMLPTYKNRIAIWDAHSHRVSTRTTSVAAGFAEVRHLFTASSVLNPNFIFTTTWVWYWEDDNVNWIQYESSGVILLGMPSTPTATLTTSLEYTNGCLDYLRPPSKNGEDTVFYDSCVNDISNPSIFVVFEKHQVYPEYLIQYEGEAETSPEQILMD
ncbi:hypothetical protein MHYP_G00173050 [Metynnis hypsauchen]